MSVTADTSTNRSLLEPFGSTNVLQIVVLVRDLVSCNTIVRGVTCDGVKCIEWMRRQFSSILSATSESYLVQNGAFDLAGVVRMVGLAVGPTA